MSERVVFLHYHGTGHINPCLALAQILKKEAFDVHFAGVDFFHRYVISQGFPHYVLKAVPFGLGFETWVNTIEKKKNIYFATLKDRVTDRLYTLREATLLQMINDLKPDVIFLDATQPTDFIILYPHLKGTTIKIAMIHAMFPTHVIPGRPPVNSDAFPENKQDVADAIRTMKKEKFNKAWKQKLKFFGFDDKFIIKRRLAKNKIPKQFQSPVLSLFNFNVQGLQEFILAPREYDFPDFVVDSHQQYIGFMMPSIPHRANNPEFSAAWEIIKEKRNTQRRKLIYCAFGTVESEDQDVIQSLLKKIASVVHQHDHLLIVSITTPSADVASLGADNIWIFRSVPQIEVLEHADLFVTHGGLSSVKEAIHAEVPMLMYAVHPDFDPKGNAARVTYHGMGLRGNAKQDNANDIEAKINRLLTERSFKDNLIRMKELNSAYTAANFITLFKTIKPLSS